MVERMAGSGRTIGGDEAIGVREALRAYTTEAAHACHWDSDAGRLTPGKRADLALLGDDPHRVDASAIGDPVHVSPRSLMLPPLCGGLTA